MGTGSLSSSSLFLLEYTRKELCFLLPIGQRPSVPCPRDGPPQPLSFPKSRRWALSEADIPTIFDIGQKSHHSFVPSSVFISWTKVLPTPKREGCHRAPECKEVVIRSHLRACQCQRGEMLRSQRCLVVQLGLTLNVVVPVGWPHGP